jgi:hypothetical protein
LKQIRKRLTYANVMSSLAVFLILGGATAFAAVKKVGPNEIKANSIKTGKIVKEAVTAGKIKKNAVTESRIADGAVTTNKLADNAVTTPKIANSAVTGVKIANGAISGEKLAAGAVSRESIAGANVLPRAYAKVNSNGTVNAAFSSGIGNGTNPEAGTFCFDLAFAPVHAQATGGADGEGDDMASVAVAGAGQTLTGCPAGSDILVEMYDISAEGTPIDEAFYLVVW